MHVGFIVANYPPRSGGVERHVASLAAELRRSGNEVTVFTLETRGRREDSGVSVVGLGRRVAVADIAALPDARSAMALPSLLIKAGVSVVSVHTRFFPATWLGIWAAHRANIPCVLTEHGSDHVESGSAVVRSAARIIDESMGRWAWGQADEVLAVSDRVAGFVVREVGRRPKTCGNGISLEWWSPSQAVLDQRRLLFVGRLVPEKGWRTFLDVVRMLPRDVTAQIVGDGPDSKSLRMAVDAKGLRARVDLLGRLPPEEVRDCMRGAVLVSPSTAAEGFQTTLLEAAASGARVVTYDVGGAAEVRSSGAAVWIVRKGRTPDLVMATNEALAASWRAAPDLERYSWRRVTGDYLAAFESVIANSR